MMATRWRKWVPESWVHTLIQIREWRPFCNRAWDFIMFEEYVEPKKWSLDIIEIDEDGKVISGDISGVMRDD